MDKNMLISVSSFLDASYREGLKGLPKDLLMDILDTKTLVDELVVKAKKEELAERTE